MTILSYCICSKTVGRDAKLYKHNIYDKTRQSVRISSFDSTTFLLILEDKSHKNIHIRTCNQSRHVANELFFTLV